MLRNKQFTTPFPLATSEQAQQYAVKNKNGAYVKLSASATALLRAVDNGLSFAEIAAALTKQQGRRVAVRDVAVAYESLIKKIESQDKPTATRLTGFWLKLTLLPKAVVHKVGRPLTVAFYPICAILLLACIIGILSSFLTEPGVWRFSPSLASFALLLFAMFFHEVGHATALLAFGETPGRIGFAAYWIVPVFFSDVTAAWRLPRKQRIVIALSGIYFHLGLCAAYALLYMLTGWEVLHAAVVALLVSSVFTLLPVFKMDGYWIISDLLGVTNLDQQRTAVLRHAWGKLKGIATPSLPWPTPVAILVSVYAVLSVAAAAYFLIQGFMLRWPHILTYPALILDIFQRLITETSTLSLFDLEQLIMETYIVLAIILGAVWLLRTGIHLIQRWWRIQQKLHVSGV